MTTTSPPRKRIKLEDEDEAPLFKSLYEEEYGPERPVSEQDKEDEMDVDHCSICLQPISDRTVIPACSHEFCFDCLLVWTEQSRRCPLCSRTIGEYLIHNIRSKYDYQKHYLAPLRTSPPPSLPLTRDGTRRRATRREVAWGRRERREQEAADELERAIEKRRWVYRHHLYAKHVASNSYTRYRPFPTPAQFAANQELITRATVFVRRELRVWDSLDVEFLTAFTISLMKSLDIRSEPAVKLLAEFLDMDEHDGANPRTNAEHFAHELYSYLRSPFRDLSVYDSVVQYDTPPDVPPPDEVSHRGRWQGYPSSSRHAEPGPSPSRADSSFQAPSRRSRSCSTAPEWSERVRREESRSIDSSRIDHRRTSSRERKTELLRLIRHTKSPSIEWTKRSHRHRSPYRSRPHADSDTNRRHRVSPFDIRERNLKHSQQDRRRYNSSAPIDRYQSRSRSAKYRAKNQSPFPRDEDEKAPTSTTRVFKGKGRAVDCIPSPPIQPPFSPNSLSQNLLHAQTQTEVQDAGRSMEDENEIPSSQVNTAEVDAATRTGRTRPRIRQNAWQAMQAHLASSHIGSNSKPYLEQRLSQPELAVPGTSSNPSSNVATPQHHVIVSSTSQTPPSEPTWQPSSPLPSVPPTTVSGTPANIDTPQEHPRTPGMTSREIMARTRAKLARLKQLSESVVIAESNVDTASTFEPSMSLTSATHVAEVANGGAVGISGAVQSSGSIQSGLFPQGAESPSLTTEQATSSGARAGYLRASLLSRLEDEKRVQTTSPTATGVNGHIHTQTVLPEGRSRPSMSAVSPTADRASPSRLKSTALNRRDAELMESKLRVQTQLRVKLAAAKRQAEQERASEG